jgi:hypothetical protein
MLLTLSNYSQIPTNGLVAYYPLTGTEDLINGNNLVLISNPAQITGIDSTQHSAYYFSNNSQRLDVLNPTALFNNTAFTINLWFKLNSNWLYNTISLIENNNSYSIQIDKNNITPSDQYTLIFNIGNNRSIQCPIFYNMISNWTNICAVYDGTYMKLYVNSILNAYDTCTINYNSINGNYKIAKHSNPGQLLSPTFRSIDNILIYNRAITTTEIINIYNIDNYIITSNKQIDYPVIQIYPNPVSNKLYINSDINTIYIYNSIGKIVDKLNNVNEIDVSKFIPGLYILELNINNTRSITKFLKQ